MDCFLFVQVPWFTLWGELFFGICWPGWEYNDGLFVLTDCFQYI